MTARAIRLRGDSDITTNIQSGPDGGGDIILRANTILAFDDSDIISSAAGGVGGNITLETPTFFGENLQLNFLGETDLNDRVDLNATGQVNGNIATPDVSFIQNSLNTLPEGILNTEALISNSCVVRDKSGSTFLVAGVEGLPERSGGDRPIFYPTGEVQSIPSVPAIEGESDRSHRYQYWQPGDAIIEAQQPYQLPNGEWIISHPCPSTQSSEL